MNKDKLKSVYNESLPLFAKMYQEYRESDVYLIVEKLLWGSPNQEDSVKSFILSVYEKDKEVEGVVVYCLYYILDSSNILEPTKEDVGKAYDKFCQDILAELEK